MNQILFNANSNNTNIINYNNHKNKHFFRWYKLMFVVSLLLLVLSVLLLFIRLYHSSKNEDISKKLTTAYSVSTMYSNSLNQTPVATTNNTIPFVIRDN